ncbi:MAG: hypothetical protein FJ106_03110 [Deltaproteobacteria bacterium]|nr:hypothetical protein [Deltaproteobacteria bacterium]
MSILTICGHFLPLQFPIVKKNNKFQLVIDCYCWHKKCLSNKKDEYTVNNVNEWEPFNLKFIYRTKSVKIMETTHSESDVKMADHRSDLFLFLRRSVFLIAGIFIALFTLQVNVCFAIDHIRTADVPYQKSDAFKEYVSEGSYFRITMPLDWRKMEEGLGLSAEEKKVYGFNFFGPISHDGIVSSISVHYYGSGNLLYQDAEQYLNIFSQPILGITLEGSEYGQVRAGLVSGRLAYLFERKVFEFKRPRQIVNQKIPVYERFVVLSADKGFFALKYSASEDIADKYQDVFEKIVGSFQPLIK